ncbi:MAG: GntR family transcriptional regulator, partial [Granulicatella sp.]
MFKYQEVSLQIRQQIEEGIYKKGDRLPSIREMIQQYHCNKDTILKALHLLKEESLIYPVEKSGYYVLKNRVPVRNTTKIGLPNPMQFPIEDFRKCLNESVMASYEGASSQKESIRGDRELIEAMVPLLESYGVYAKEGQLSITTGTQQALYILLQLIGTGGLLLEQPTYSRMNQLVKELGIPF